MQPLRKEFCQEKVLNDSFCPSIPTFGSISQRNNSKEKNISYKEIYSCSYILEQNLEISQICIREGEWCTNAMEIIATRSDNCEGCKTLWKWPHQAMVILKLSQIYKDIDEDTLHKIMTP